MPLFNLFFLGLGWPTEFGKSQTPKYCSVLLIAVHTTLAGNITTVCTLMWISKRYTAVPGIFLFMVVCGTVCTLMWISEGYTAVYFCLW